MKIWNPVLIFAASSLAVCSQTCPSDHFPAIFTGTVEGLGPSTGPVEDPELYIFL